MAISDAVTEHRSAFLELEYSASAPYNDFVYEDRAQADVIRALLFDKGVAEYSQFYSRILHDSGRVIGMASCLSADQLIKCRMRSAYALARSGLLERAPGLSSRLSLAGQSLMRLQGNDFYLSRIAVAAEARGAGAAGQLLAHCEQQALESGASRMCLEVSSENAAALSFYEKNGFREIARRSVVEMSSGRSLDYTHMAKAFTPTFQRLRRAP